MRVHPRLAFVPGLVFLVAACGTRQNLSAKPGSAVLATERVTGEIYDTWDQKPVRGASVEILGDGAAVATTDARGAFVFNGVRIGKRRVRIAAQAESFVLEDLPVEAGRPAVWRIGLPTSSSRATMRQAMEQQGAMPASIKGWSDLEPRASFCLDVTRVQRGWTELVEQYRQATQRAATSRSLQPFAATVPGGSRMAAFLAYLMHSDGFTSGGTSEMTAPPPALLLADMIHTMDVLAMRPSTDYPFGIDVFLADDRLAPLPDRENITRKNTPSMLVSEVGGHLVFGAVSPMMAETLESAWRSALLAGSPWRHREASEGQPTTLFEQMAKLHAFDDLICPRCEDLLTDAIVARHLPGWTPVANPQASPDCRLECQRRLGRETITLTGHCGLKNEHAKRYDSEDRRLKDEPLIETSRGSGGNETYVSATVSDNDTPCVFGVVRSGPYADGDHKKEVLALAKDIAAAATPDLMSKKTYEALVVGEDDTGALAESWSKRLSAARRAIEILLPFAPGFPKVVDDQGEPGLPKGKKALLLARCPNGRSELLVDLLAPLVPDIKLLRVAGDKPERACPQLPQGWVVTTTNQDAFPRSRDLRLRMTHIFNGDLVDDDAQPDASKPNPGTTDKAVVYLLDENNHVLDWKPFEFPDPTDAETPSSGVDRPDSHRTCALGTSAKDGSLKLEWRCTLRHERFCVDYGNDTVTHTLTIQGKKIAIRRKHTSTAPRSCEGEEEFSGFGRVAPSSDARKRR
jgi:hypothetical protein